MNNDEAQLHYKIRLLEEKVKQQKSIIDKWCIESDGDVSFVNNTLTLSVSFRNGVGSGVLHTFTLDQCRYIANDPDTLISEITFDIFNRLYKDEIKKIVAPPIVKGLQNISIMEGKV